MGTFQKHLHGAMCLFLVASLWACGTASQPFQYETDPAHRALVDGNAPAYPATRFVVLSDPHLYDTTLGTEGRAFEAYLAGDRKLLKESPEIMDAAARAIMNEAPDFVLVPGDLTKDGEASSHYLMAQYLSRIEASGTPVYITPGNHDIRNGESVRYRGDTTERVDNVSAAAFAQIYSAFGYAEALHRDPASLSYVAEPKAGLWLLALDACRYSENQEDQPPITDGAFSAATVTWIEDMLAEAAKTHRAVIVMMHHGVMEHYQGQEKYYGEYIVDDYARIARLFAMYHVRMVFTGHYHAQDVTLERWTASERVLYDIETGSLVT
jgi:3',5'-cyclic AMP phosphodiesterase CpdA